MVSNFEFVTYPLVVWVMWYLIVSILDLCTLTYYASFVLYFQDMSENDLDAFAASLLADTLAENDCLVAVNLSGIFL